MLDLRYDENVPLVGPNSLIVPFLACGDLSGYDADTTYQLGEDYTPLQAVQKPIDPPYQHAVELRRKNQLSGFNTQKPQEEIATFFKARRKIVNTSQF